MTVMRVAAANGYVLTYDTEDVEDFEVSTKADHREVGVTPSGFIKRELTGDHHLTLRIDFKHGKKALWVKEDEPAEPIPPALPPYIGAGPQDRVRAFLEAVAATTREHGPRSTLEPAGLMGWPGVDGYYHELTAADLWAAVGKAADDA